MEQHHIHPRPHLFAHMDLEPIVSDPDHYCRSCDMYFISRVRYRDHLENAHHMILKPLRAPIYILDGNPDFYCEQCDTYSKNKYMFRYHLQKKHNVELPPLKRKPNPDITPDLDNPDLYCASCERNFKQKGAYRTHCSKIHGIKLTRKCRIRKEGIPDITDPNDYCRICEYTFSTRQKFKRHCLNVHKIDDPSLRPPMLKRVTIPKFFCKTCDIALYKDTHYLRHLSLTHDVDMVSMHNDDEDSDSRPDIIELIVTREAELNQSQPQIVTVNIESTDTLVNSIENPSTSIESPSTITENPSTPTENPFSFIVNPFSSTMNPFTFTENHAKPYETHFEFIIKTQSDFVAPRTRRTQRKKRVQFIDLPSDESEEIPAETDEARAEFDGYEPELDEDDHRESGDNASSSDEYVP